jgi:hypothetical protein
MDNLIMQTTLIIMIAIYYIQVMWLQYRFEKRFKAIEKKADEDRQSANQLLYAHVLQIEFLRRLCINDPVTKALENAFIEEQHEKAKRGEFLKHGMRNL